MSQWRFQITDDGERDIGRLDSAVEERVREKLEWLAGHFDEVIGSPLKFDYRGFSKLRVGDWRIIYQVIDAEWLVRVHGIDHRSKVYKKRR